MARRSQCSSAGDNPLDPNYLPPHYREEYRLAVDALVEEDLEGYYDVLQKANVVDFLSRPEIHFIRSSVQVPQQSSQKEHHFHDTGGDGSSDTYWPIHSDLDPPGLDLGWPNLHHFNVPTEVTTLINPPEPYMPSIKEQARRLIKNAQQVIAIVMDMFTDIDMFADILNAAMRNVAVYVILDEQNAHHFTNMVSNCRVNLQSIQFLRVRTVTGTTYHCRSGKTFKGQMMDRFLLTDCRAVLSGNYSFMWSFEKIHRCMAHLFLGQLVSTFDEEFRILFAQSQPLMIENVPAPMEEFNPLQKRQFPHERTSLYRDPRKCHPDDDRTDIDWRMMPLKNPADPHRRFSSMQSLVDPSLDQGHSRMPTMDNPAFKRHSFAEGGHGRYSYPFLQPQELPDLESQGRHFDRGQQSNVRAGPEANYSGYDTFWNQDKSGHSADEYSDPGLPQDTDNFDPVLHYLSSTRNVEFDNASDSFLPAGDLPLSYPRRSSLDQSYACQTSPTPSNPTDQKQFFPPSSDRKDPIVKRGLRNYRLSSYLSAYDNPGDEGLPLAPSQVPDPLDEQSNPAIQQKKTGTHFSVPKIPQFREFKVPALRRASQMPNYIKHVQEQSEKSPDESTAVGVETKSTPTPSESSSTTEGDKTEEAEQKEPKTSVVRREESFRRKYNPAVPRSSRLRSSLIFSSLDQQTAAGQQDEEGDKAEQTKLPFASQILGQKRSATKEPFEWSRYIKSATFDGSGLEASKPDDGTSKAEERDSSSKDENSKNPPENPEVQESLKQSDEAELPKTDQLVQPPKSLLTPLFLDMSDPDERLKFFKEMAAKRKATKAAEGEKSTVQAPMKATTDLNVSDETKKWGSQVNNDPNTSKCCEEEQTTVSTDSEKIEMKNNQAASLPVCAETETPQSEPSEDTKLSKRAVKGPSPCQSPITPVPSLVQVTDKSEKPNSIPQTTCSPTAFSFAPLSTPAETVSSDITQEDSSSTLTSSILSPISDKIKAKECFSPPLPDSAQSADEALQTYTSSDVQAKSTQALLDSVAVDSSHVEFDISPDTCAAGSVPSSLESTTKTNSEESCWILSDSQRDALQSENSPIAEEFEVSSSVLASPKDTKADSITPSLSSPSTEWCLPIVSDLESGYSTSDQKGAITPNCTPGDAADEQSDIPPDAPQSERSACSQDAPTLANYPSELYPTSSDSPIPAETIPCSSPLSDSFGSVMSPKAEKTKTNMPVLHSSSDTISFTSETPTDSNKAPHPTESPFSPTGPTSIVTSVTTEPDLPSKRSESVTSESHTSESSVPADISFTDEHELSEPFEEANVDTEATNKVNNSTTRESNDQARQNNCSKLAESASDEVVPLSPQSEKPKSTQSRYHSSTAKVLSSSNLRDDTKLLLGQISANSQNRNEMTKELSVTDDEKEDKADKNAISAKERGIRSFGRAPPKSAEERKELLEKIQSMRKDKKVYSRFEMAP
ncbi:protein FAM83H [Scomber scombrus]|uniref:protein FAM83H n=1 Tax=Scomber scombrus TaxID=13677 RepID=UPI002DD8AB1C|nr:protein FAM83H [Scomber scombrus]